MALDQQQVDQQAEFFANRLKKRFRHLWKYARRVGTTAFRVYHRDIPELPFAVDWYDNHLHVAEYDRPHDRTPQEHSQWIDRMIDVASRTLTVAPDRVFTKRREHRKGGEGWSPPEGSAIGYTIDVEEHGLLFRVNLSDYLDTGLFLDHRDLRLHVAKRCTGKRVLNLFGYTGAFTVYAVAAGASSSLTLDLSNTYLDWARTNLEINALVDNRHELAKADVLAEIPALKAAGRTFDVIILDPPSFSNSKSMSTTFDVQRDHVELIRSTASLLAPGGELFFSTNKRRFQFGKQELGMFEIRKLTKLTMPEDFAGTNIHQVWSFSQRR